MAPDYSLVESSLATAAGKGVTNSHCRIFTPDFISYAVHVSPPSMYQRKLNLDAEGSMSNLGSGCAAGAGEPLMMQRQSLNDAVASVAPRPMGCEEGAAARPGGDERSEHDLPDNANEAMFHEWVAGEIRACTAYGQYPEVPLLCVYHESPLPSCSFLLYIHILKGSRHFVCTCVASSTSRQIMEQAIVAICGWRKRFRNDRDLWARIMRRDRVIKELNECMPVIAHTVEMVSRLKLDEGGDKAVVLDLCSGTAAQGDT